ncbi:DsbA family protein [Paracoccaceae bacterium GXU_MW_L88]
MTRLEIWSDPICPWCWIGSTGLFRAIEAIGDTPFEVSWHPFFLNPEMPPGGMDRRAYLEAKFGGKAGAAKAYMPVSENAEAMNLPLNLDKIGKTPRTQDAHRLIHWAGIEGKQTGLAMALFEAYFRDGKDIGDAEVLAEIGGHVGLDRDLITRLLATDQDLELVETDAARGRDMGITGAPTFIIAGAHVVPGAQPAHFWERVAREILTAQKDMQPE